MAKGQAFLSEGDKTPRGVFKHLNVIITEPSDEKTYLVVPVTHYRRDSDKKPLPGQDASCVLQPGSHPFIKDESYVRYKSAKKMTYAEIYNGIHRGLLVKKEDVDPLIVQKMQQGAKSSPHLPEELIPLFDYFLKDDGENPTPHSGAVP